MKKLKRIGTVLLSAILGVFGVGAMSACNEKVAPDGETTLDIMILNKGFGTDWLYALKDAFEEKNPGITITVKPEYSESTLDTAIGAGLEYNRYDLFFGGSVMNSQVEGQLKGNTDYFEDLAEVYEAVPEGETRPIGEKFTTRLKDAYTFYEDGEERYFTMPWVLNVNGLLCNNEAVVKVLGENWQETYPCRTTDELIEFCTALSGKLSAFVHCADKQFYHFMYETWWAQYEGLEGIENFYSGLAYDELEGKYVTSTAIFEQPGRLAAMKVMERLFNPVNGFSMEESSGFTWNQAQMNFMAGNSAMFSNGDWNNIEMGKSFPDSDIRFIKMPIVSELGAKLGITETELRTAIDYADALSDGESPAAPTMQSTQGLSSEEVLQAVCKARQVAHTTSQYFSAYVASYGLGKELAKDFLIFMASDEGQKIFADATGGLTMPYSYDLESDSEGYAKYSEFAKSRWNIVKNADYFYYHFELPLGGAGLLPFEAVKLAPIEVLMSRKNDPYTAQEIVDEDINYYGIPQRWTNLLRKAGLA